jgi:hypothetical protein
MQQPPPLIRDVAQLMTDLSTYFALSNQAAGDMDIRALVARWLHGKLITLDNATALAARTANLEDQTTWSKTLVQLDPLAGA